MLNRMEALGLIEGCEAERDPADRLPFLQDLQEHWIGHRDVLAGDPAEAAEDLAQTLAEYVDECASPRNDRTPRGTDPTGLTAPSGVNWE